jgi:peptidoglycan/LPS O-acetylase OafA/YrhL
VALWVKIRHRGAGGRSFRADIQGLRALAVLFVVFYHAKLPFFSGGYVGVDVFFVISGYLISGLLIHEMEEKGSIDFLAFYARRMRRLLPAAIFVLLATGVAARLWLSPLEQREFAPAVLVSALYASNFWFASKATDYLGGDVQVNPLLHTWSLSVEEQFYLIWPLLILLGARASSPTRMKVGCAVTMAATFVLSLGGSLWAISVSQPWAFFGSPMRAWEFAAGGLAYIATRRVTALSDWAKDGLVALGLAGTLGAVVLFNDRTRFPGVAALVPVISTALMLVAGAGRGRMTRWLETPAMQTIGNLSYSWYLWHWPILVFPLAGMLSLPGRLAGIVGSFLLAWGTYVVIENRVRFSPLLAPSPLRSVVLGICLTCAGAGSALAFRSLAQASMIAPGHIEYMRVRDERSRISREGCHQGFPKEEIAECAYGDTTAHRTMVLVGDSHAAQWFPALERMAQEKGWRLVSLTKSACPWVWVTPYNLGLGRPYEECARWRAVVVQRISKERPALVVLANASKFYMQAPGQAIEAEKWRAGMHRTLVELRRAGAFVVILRDTPSANFDVPICLSRAAWRRQDLLSSCSFDRGAALDISMFALEQRAAEEIDHVSVIDLTDLLCRGSLCQPIIGARVAYRDSNHLTTGVSISLAPVLAERVGSQLLE